MQPPLRPAMTTPHEERANTLTHGVGTLAAFAVAVVTIVLAAVAGEPLRIVTLSVFCVALIGVYGTSTLYHLVQRPRPKAILRKMDHAAIFVLIAASYTPFMLVAVGGAWGWSLFGVAWGLAVIGVWLNLKRFGKHERLELGLVLLAGWLAMVGIVPMVAGMSGWGLFWLVAGGVAYTAGVVFFLWEKMVYNHAVWHGFVLAGSACHVVAIYLDVLPGG